MTSANDHPGQKDGIAIVGGGLAAQRCAEALRREGYDGAIRMVCAEAHQPYDRPPLSKQVLMGVRSEQSLSFRPTDWYQQHAIDLLLGVSATALHPARRALSLSDGATLPYHRLLIATGSRPRQLPSLARYGNVSVLRTVDDSVALREVLSARPRLAVIGAGFIGQEVAASARKLGAEVTIVEAASAPLAGVLGHELGDWFTRLHQAEGTAVLTGRTVSRVTGNGRVEKLCLSDGCELEADHVIVGVGVAPETEWLRDSGLQATSGVPVDPHGRSPIPGVLAAGDAAASFDPALGRHVPGSHWEAAGRQGARAARVMLGLDPGPAPLTSFWTDQYGTRIQYLGHASLGSHVVIDGELDSRSFTATFMRGKRAVAALLVGRPRELPRARNLIEKGTQ